MIGGGGRRGDPTNISCSGWYTSISYSTTLQERLTPFPFYLNLLIFREKKGNIELFYLFMHSLIDTYVLIEDQTRNLGISGQHSNHLSNLPGLRCFWLKRASVWLSWLGAVPCTLRLPVGFQVRAHAWATGSLPQ